MKSPVLSVLTLACAAAAIAIPDWKQSLNAAYANPLYTISNAVISQQISVAGCKSLKSATEGDITLFDDGSYTMNRDDWSVTVLQGTWAMVPGKSSDTVYLSINRNSLSDMFTEFESDALENCQDKYPSMTYVDVVEPTTMIKKNMIVVKVKDNAAKGSLQLTAKQQNDQKGGDGVIGNMSAKVMLTGTMEGPLSPP